MKKKKFLNRIQIGGYYRFDFYVENKYLIEYDGIQHFSPGSGWNTLEQLKKTQEKDKLKNLWCQQHNIPLIRIPYTHLDEITIEDLKINTSNFLLK